MTPTQHQQPHQGHQHAILAEASASERRVLVEAHAGFRAAGVAVGVMSSTAHERAERMAERREYAAAFDAAERYLAAQRPLVDEQGYEFVAGCGVVTLTELWCSNPNRPTDGPKMMVAGTPGVIASIGASNATILFHGRTAPYFMRLDQMRVVLKIVKVASE